MLNMVRRNFTRGTAPTIRCEIYKSLVRPSMEYGSIVWDPHQLTRIKTLKAVQNKGARYVNQDWDRHTSVTTMKKDLGWLTLQERRLVNRLTFLMKSFITFTDIHFHHMWLSQRVPYVLDTLNRTPTFEPGLTPTSFHSYPEASGLGIVCPRKLLPSRTQIHTEMLLPQH